MYKKYFFIYILSFTAIISIVMVANYQVIKNTGELLTTSEIIEKQYTGSKNNKLCLYGSTIFNNSYLYKLLSYQKIKPDVFTLGSSRVLQLREKFFKTSFYNGGAMLRELQSSKEFIRNIIGEHKPKIILLGIDFWWFNEKYKWAGALAEENNLRILDLLEPVAWLVNGKIDFRFYTNLLLGKKNEKCSIGISGILHKTGFDIYGSYYYTDAIYGHKKIYDTNFRSMKSKIDDGIMYFPYNSKVDEDLYNNFIDVLQMFESEKVKVILFFPPLASAVSEYMSNFKDDFDYINDLKNRLKEDNIDFLDITSPQQLLETSDCEFIDGIHGGDLLYAKILLYIADKKPFLKEYINEEYLKEITEKYKGLAMIPDKKFTDEKEVDFLELGCKK